MKNPGNKGKGKSSGAFYVRIIVNGKPRFKDSKGRFVSFEKVQKSKRKVYDWDKVKKEPLKPVESKVKQFRPGRKDEYTFNATAYGQTLARNFSAYLSDGYEIGIRVGGKIYKTDKGNFESVQQFQRDILKRYMDLFGDVVEYPELSFGISEHGTLAKVIFDLDNITLFSPETMEALSDEMPEIAENARELKNYIKNKSQEYFISQSPSNEPKQSKGKKSAPKKSRKPKGKR